MPLFTLTRHGGRALLATAALALLAACGDSLTSTTTPQPSADANASDVLRLNLSSTTASFVQASGASALPKPIVIIASNPAALIPSTGIQVSTPIYTNAPGWLTVTPKILGLTASITLTINPNNLVNGGYTATFTVKVPGTTNSPVKVTVFYAKGFYFADGGEGPNAWTMNSLWHLSPLLPICNVSQGTCLPAPDEGLKAWWYGMDATGDYDVGPGSTNSGDLTTPEFSIPSGAVEPTLGFRSTWENEGGSWEPKTVYIWAFGGWQYLGNINNLPGYNPLQMPTYVTVKADLTPYAGQTVRIRFNFNTLDGVANDFRGWIVDRVVVAEPAYFDALSYPNGFYLNNEEEGCGDCESLKAGIRDPFRITPAMLAARRGN